MLSFLLSLLPFPSSSFPPSLSLILLFPFSLFFCSPVNSSVLPSFPSLCFSSKFLSSSNPVFFCLFFFLPWYLIFGILDNWHAFCGNFHFSDVLSVFQYLYCVYIIILQLVKSVVQDPGLGMIQLWDWWECQGLQCLTRVIRVSNIESASVSFTT